MATRPKMRCPICLETTGPGEDVIEHLIENHTKRELAGELATDVVARETQEFDE